MTQEDKRTEWARLGTRARLIEIEAEREAIFRAFPELRRGRHASRRSVPGRRRVAGELGSLVTGRKRRGMTAAWRAKLAAAAKRRWPEAKKAGRTRL
jgi:hypothetical protein